MYDKTLLYIEDDRETASFMEEVLAEYFSTVYTAHSGEEALDITIQKDIDLVLTDIELPGMNGLETLQRIREQNKYAGFIVFSAYDMKEYLFEAIDIGVCGYLVKPFHLDQFERVMQKCILQLDAKDNTKEQLQKLAYYDQLTNIYSRHKLVEIFEQLRKRGRPFGILLFDLDDFKKINDTYGHNVGDIILKEFAKVIQQYIRKDDYFGRWGGEEFLMFIPDIDTSSLYTKAQELRRAIAEHDFKVVDGITTSIGAGIYDTEDSLTTALESIDKALYQAKHSGKNRVELVKR